MGNLWTLCFLRETRKLRAGNPFLATFIISEFNFSKKLSLSASKDIMAKLTERLFQQSGEKIKISKMRIGVDKKIYPCGYHCLSVCIEVKAECKRT